MIKAVAMFVACLKFITCDGANIEAFVVEGKYSKIEDFPHSAYIESLCGKKKFTECGSSILNQWILLTAAHCMPPIECPYNKRVTARFGHEDKTKGIFRESSAYFYHEDYIGSANALEYDIALVLLNKQIEFSKKVSRVAITKAPVHDKDIVTMAGWGYVNETVLKKTKLLKDCTQQIIIRDRCVKQLRNLPTGVICAKDRWGKSYPSGGDSGSALISNDYIQVGLVSYKMPDNPSLIVYTDVTYFYDWITANVNKLICTIGKNSTV